MSRPADHIDRVLDGKYRLRRIVGSGGMGTVYEGVHVGIGKRLAIKLISADAPLGHVSSARFLQEARAASAVESDHIVEIFDVGEDPQAGLFMVMEFLVGEDLAQKLRRDGPLDPRFVVNMGCKLAGALKRAHAAGIVHRDIKPANVFLDRKDDGSVNPKLLDFGLSMMLEKGAARSDAAASITGGTATVGTPHYMSPEQAQGMPVDCRSDVWSFGAVLYEALAGVPPYKPALTYERTIIDIVTKRAPPLASVAPWVPAPVAEVIHLALQHELGARIQDFGTFAAMLRSALPEAFLPGVERRVATPLPERPPSWRPPEPDELPRLAGYDEDDDDGLTSVDQRVPLEPLLRAGAVDDDEPFADQTMVEPSPLLIAGDDWESEDDATAVAPSPLGPPAAAPAPRAHLGTPPKR